MKKLINRILCLALCAFALACGAAMAEPVFTVGDYFDNGGYYAGYITSVEMDSETETLIIPGTIKQDGMDIVVVGVKDVDFNKHPQLKYIRVDVAKIKDLTNDSLDFSSAENLEYIYINEEITDSVLKKFKTYGNTEILQYKDLTDKHILTPKIAYENGAVKLTFPDISVGAISYRIIRAMQNSTMPVIFDSMADDSSNFDISNGMVCFTDNTVEPGRTYYYSVKAVEPFGSSCTSDSTSISIPNSAPDSIPEEKPLPQTGDGANPVLWATLAMMSIACMLILRRKREA